jgi:hypothetical protein
VLDQHGHLLVSHETLESLPRHAVDGRLDDGLAIVPPNPRSEREQVLHESSLAGQEHLDGAVAEARRTALLAILPMTIDSLHSILGRHKLDIAVLRLGRHAFHDDVNRLLIVVQNLGVPAKKGDDLGALGAERDLRERMQVS